ncbi:hypothetical protein TWF481_006323 [Arthrobotrys musiformis]|uniref:Nucleotidyl transferase AbiEii/AbiGii toxin family protein n=1 Tax=Arthrobotrys musiformis TaxID=47236 RepID=A0AAV9WIB9_9PEZI
MVGLKRNEERSKGRKRPRTLKTESLLFAEYEEITPLALPSTRLEDPDLMPILRDDTQSGTLVGINRSNIDFLPGIFGRQLQIDDEEMFDYELEEETSSDREPEGNVSGYEPDEESGDCDGESMGFGIGFKIASGRRRRSDKTSLAVDRVAKALISRFKSFFREGVMYFAGGFAMRVKGDSRATTDIDIEVSQRKYLKILEVKIQRIGFIIKNTSAYGFDAVDKATGIPINVRMTLFSRVEPRSYKRGGYRVLVQKLNALPNHGDTTRQRTDIEDIGFLLRRGIPCMRGQVAELFDQKEALLEAIAKRRIFIEEGRVRTLIEGLRGKSLAVLLRS